MDVVKYWGPRLYVLGGLAVATGCSVDPSTNATFDAPPSTSISTTAPSDDSGTTAPATSTSGEAEGSEDTEAKLDTPFQPGTGCEYIDFLFVIDNSASMATYQLGLTEQFPGFITAMYDSLPPGIDVHVGLTTTDFDPSCDATEATQNCQSTATLDEVQSHYIRPDEMNAGGNGAQGKLFEYAGQRYFETNSSDDPAALSDWFTEAAVAAGEEGCTFEMPVAAAGFATHLSNAVENDGFLRDESALLVIFFLTDEPDKSPESETVYWDMIMEAKAVCGGEECVFVSGLVPTCVTEINQKLWQFMKLPYDDESQVPYGDIELTGEYANVFGDALAGAIAEACANVPIP